MRIFFWRLKRKLRRMLLGLFPGRHTADQRQVEGDVDLLVRDMFFADPAYRGIIIEVGAAKPDFLSISRSFRLAGWRAVAIEPNPAFCAMHRQQGSEVLEFACGAVDQDDVPFFIVESSVDKLGGTATNESFSSLGIRGPWIDFSQSVPTTTTEIRVRVRRLETILRELNIEAGNVDILSIDVEGWEMEVLAGLNASQPGPRVLLIENWFKDQRYVEAITARGYRLWERWGPNEIYVRRNFRK